MESASVLILGGNGYVGSALVRHLRAEGLAVSCVDKVISSNSQQCVETTRSFQDLTRAELLAFSGIVLLAGHSSVAACDKQPNEAFANNVTAFVDLLRKLRGQKFLFASSSSVYIHTHGRVVAESEPFPRPVSAYDHHKQIIEEHARNEYANSYALRFGTVCGPSPNMRRDLLLNSLVWSAMTRKYIDVANRAYHRPILGIHDLCRAIAMLLTQPIEPGPYNLASANVSIGEVADYVAARFQVPCREVERPTQYDILVSTDKFTRATGMESRDTVASLVEELAACYGQEAAQPR
jgi:UDP-glucose 4-epimerase